MNRKPIWHDSFAERTFIRWYEMTIKPMFYLFMTLAAAAMSVDQALICMRSVMDIRVKRIGQAHSGRTT